MHSKPGATAQGEAAKGPGALVRTPRRISKTAPETNFAHSGPQWGRIKTYPSTPKFCTPEGPCHPKGTAPVNGVQGAANMGACAHFERPPGASLVSFWAPRKKLAARDMSRKNKNFPGGETRPSTGSEESPRCPPPFQWSGSPRHSRSSRSPGCGPGPPPACPAGSVPPGTPC